ncbi:MAG: YezD family protein [Opitutaceae bacterium]|jgi:hypothetical protein|nr:YezD family protein [Opitutaceae bacterium]
MSLTTNVFESTPGVPEWLEIVKSKVDGLRFGVVQIIVHDGKITQIERTEKTRLEAPTTAPPVQPKTGQPGRAT